MINCRCAYVIAGRLIVTLFWYSLYHSSWIWNKSVRALLCVDMNSGSSSLWSQFIMKSTNERQMCGQVWCWRSVIWKYILLSYPNSLIPFHSKRGFLWRFNVICNSKTQLILYIQKPIFFSPIVNNYGFFRQIFVEVSNIKFLLKTVQWEQRWYMWLDGRTWRN